MKKVYIFIIPFLFLYLSTLSAQIGTWTMYPSYYNITEIAPAKEKAFALASGALFSYNTTDGSTQVYDKTNCLSDVSISHIKYNATCKKLIITYDNSNIDVLDLDQKVENISDFYHYSTTDNKAINHIYNYGQYTYLSTGLGILKLNVKDGSISDSYLLGFGVNYSYIDGNYIYAASESAGLYRGKLTDNLLDKKNWTRIGDYVSNNENALNVYDSTTKYWWTTTSDGKLTYYTKDANDNRTYKVEGIRPDSPASNYFRKLYLHNGCIYAVAGTWSQEGDGNRTGEVHIWKNNTWQEFEQPTTDQIENRYVDLICLDFDPKKEGHIMVGAKGGLYEFQDNKFIKQYNRDNSPLQSCINSKNYLLITGIKYDKEGNLWVLNSTSNTDYDYPIWCYSQSNDKWTSYTHNEMNGYYNGNMINFFDVSYDNRLWFINDWWESCKLYAFDPSTDQLTHYGPSFINEDDVALTPRYLLYATEDKKGNIWLGTSLGPIYLPKANIANGSTTFVQHKVPRNDGTNYADYLLSGVEVRCIAVDASNRKWMGTNNNGIYVISDDCNTEVYHFTTDNSPLPSNIIHDIIIMPNGLVYIATDKGFCSYMSDVTETSDEMTKDNVYAYPNPVKPDYTGSINIVGLSNNADVKIVSSNGTLVNQGRSTGGSYSWDGCDLKGRKVVSGIYMVETATESGEKGTVCKIAIVR